MTTPSLADGNAQGTVFDDDLVLEVSSTDRHPLAIAVARAISARKHADRYRPTHPLDTGDIKAWDAAYCAEQDMYAEFRRIGLSKTTLAELGEIL